MNSMIPMTNPNGPYYVTPESETESFAVSSTTELNFARFYGPDAEDRATRYASAMNKIVMSGYVGILRKLDDIRFDHQQLRTHAMDTLMGAIAQDFSDVKSHFEKIEGRLQRLESLLSI